MKVALFDAHHFERKSFDSANTKFAHGLTYLELRLTPETAKLAAGFPCVCAFTNDRLNHETLNILKSGGTQLIALRSAGFNNIDLAAAKQLNIQVVRVPAYSPYAVAEHAVALLLALNRKTCKAHSRVQDLNFSLEGLVGFDLHGKTVGIIGTGRIGAVMAKIMHGFGCNVLAFDPIPNPELETIGARYVTLNELYLKSDIISLHAPLTPATRHLIDEAALKQMKPGIYIINTSRGALINTKALVTALKSAHVGAAGLDVYEEEETVFFQDLSEQVLQDDVLARLLTFPNVLITSHQGFLTHEALTNIAETTLKNIEDYEKGRPLVNEVQTLNPC